MLPLCFGPILIMSCLRKKDTRLSARYIFAFQESLGTRLTLGLYKQYPTHSKKPLSTLVFSTMWYIGTGNNLVIVHCWVVFRILFVYIYYANPQLSTSAITMPECNSALNYCTVYCLQFTAILDYINPTFVGILQTLLKYVLIGTMRSTGFFFSRQMHKSGW